MKPIQSGNFTCVISLIELPMSVETIDPNNIAGLIDANPYATYEGSGIPVVILSCWSWTTNKNIKAVTTDKNNIVP